MFQAMTFNEQSVSMIEFRYESIQEYRSVLYWAT